MNQTNRLNVNNVDTIEQKLEQNEKIMQIYSESLPHCQPCGNSKSNINGLSPSESILTEPQLFNTAPAILKLFAKQLLTLTKNCDKTAHAHLYKRHPNLQIWLKLLNTTPSTIDAMGELSFHDLFEKSDTELRDFLDKSATINASELEIQMISSSFQNLKTFYKNLEKSNSTVSTPNSLPSLSLTPTNDTKKPSADVNNNTLYSPLLTAYSNPAYLSTKSASSDTKTPASSTVTQTSTTASGSSSSSSELLNSSNLNKSQLSSSSTSSIASENRQKQASPKAADIELKSNGKPHTKSESDSVVSGNDTLEDFYEAIRRKACSNGVNYDLNSKLISLNNGVNSGGMGNQITKNLTFSPILPVKTAKKSGGQQKVTTPPPFRKLSTGSPYNQITVNSQIHAVARAAVEAQFKANFIDKKTPHKSDISTTQSPPNIRRSSSHESHLRNRIPAPVITHQNLIVGNKFDVNNQSNSSSENIYRTNDGSESSSRVPSGQASPIVAQSPVQKNANNMFTDDYFKTPNLSIPKSPKQFRDHRWVNTLKVANCGICSKKMIIGIKCRTCKFVKYVRIKNIKICELCRKPLWVGLKCKNCKFRCHKECEKKFSPICPSVFMAFLPPVSSHQSTHASDTNLANTPAGATLNSIDPATQANLILQSSSIISSSSSGASSTLPSPALINNNINPTSITEHSWPSGASKVARVANKIVNSINSVSTPKSSPKSLAHLTQQQPIQPQMALPSPKNFFSNESHSSSCNSSGPNSPNYFKDQQKLLHKHLHLTNGQDKKSSSSSASISSGIQTQLRNPNIFEFRNANPTIKRTTSIDSNQLDDSMESPGLLEQHCGDGGQIEDTNLLAAPNNLYSAASKDGTETTKEQLELRKSNNSTVVDSNNDMDTDLESTNQNYPEYETNEQDHLNFSQDFKQFDITYEEITDKIEIGRGRFGCVYKAHWHGPHAVKEIHFDENLAENSHELNNFKQEVLNLKKTRHANLILFVGACMKPPKCAIVMSLCRGVSLYKYLHTESYQKPPFDWTIDIATQIAQGMGYLHNKKMIHKDLRSKNIFIDGCKAVIADFGLYSITRLCKKLKRRDLLPITKECVYYMAPELVRLLGTSEIDAAFSQASDVFSFGTVWYELFCFEYPFQSKPTDTVIYMIGNSLKIISPNIQISKDFKNILLKCWSKEPSARPNFSHLLETFRAIPKRTKLFRSPSHPVHIGRSLEALHSIDMKN